MDSDLSHFLVFLLKKLYRDPCINLSIFPLISKIFKKISFSLFVLIFIFYLAMPQGMWDLSYTRDQACAPCIGSTES